MARKSTSGTSSTSPTVAKLSQPVGQPNQTVASIKAQAKIEDERQRKNYAKASADSVMRTLRDVTKNKSGTSLRKTSRNEVTGYLQGDIYNNSKNLINASRYLYYRSPIYSKMCELYASMYCLDCRILSPRFTFSKDFDVKKSLKQFDATVDFLDMVSLKNNLAAPLLNMMIDDVSFNLYFHDDTGAAFYRIDPTEAMIDSYYEAEGGTCYGFAMDMSKWKSAQRQALIEWLGEPLTSMYREYESTKVKYIHVPAEYSFVLKFRTDMIDAVIPPILHYISQLANLNDLMDTQADADDLSYYKLIYLPMRTLSGAKQSDDWEITPDLTMDYFQIAADEAFPPGISHAVIPGDKLETIDFSDNVSESVNRVESSQQQMLGSAGGVGALINSAKAVNNTALINAALKAESAYVIKTVLPQITAWVNLQQMLDGSNYCRVDLLPVTIYTKDEYREKLLEANQHGYAYRLAYGTLLGFSERQTMSLLHFENEALGLYDLMSHPLSSSYTQSGNNIDDEGGRPEKDVTELSPSGERSRNQ